MMRRPPGSSLTDTLFPYTRVVRSYRGIFRYSGTAAMQMVLRAFALYGLLYPSVVTAIGLPGVPRSVGIIQPLLLLLAVGASRALARYWLGGLYQNIFQRMNLPKAVIYGAGQAGRQLAPAMAHGHEMRVVRSEERSVGKEGVSQCRSRW